MREQSFFFHFSPKIIITNLFRDCLSLGSLGTIVEKLFLLFGYFHFYDMLLLSRVVFLGPHLTLILGSFDLSFLLFILDKVYALASYYFGLLI